MNKRFGQRMSRKNAANNFMNGFMDAVFIYGIFQ